MIAIPEPIDVPLRRDSGDVIRVGPTRVTLQSVIIDFNKGSSAEEIVHHYPALDLSDVYVVIGYYLQNKDAIDAYVQEQRELSAQARREAHAEFPQDALRAKLLARLEAHRRSKGS